MVIPIAIMFTNSKKIISKTLPYLVTSDLCQDSYNPKEDIYRN